MASDALNRAIALLAESRAELVAMVEEERERERVSRVRRDLATEVADLARRIDAIERRLDPMR